ncbi:hypothetical protein EZV62_025447 [Acer yangbiense]|uniref:Bromo domain-containing protein n=1 Tax=Acer yangbiense TaxID=1000413 RepID=A0A5C7GZ18_9ROSI|nr:hypothetical protein EZV62_025447 [Acer yangbiense]
MISVGHNNNAVLEQKVDEIEQFYLNTSKIQPSTSKGSSIVKDKDKERHVPGIRKQKQEASRREKAAEKRMEELMRQLGTILRNLTQHKWARPFLQPVDVKGLGLDDYYEVIDKPMDFSTVKKQMEAKEYKNVREICTDVRLIFKNAMEYNDERSDVHIMAKTLLAKFEEKWLQLLPKVTEEVIYDHAILYTGACWDETRREEEEAEAQLDMQLAQEAAHAKMTRDISNEACRFMCFLKQVMKTSTEEKRKLGAALSRLSPDDLSKALEIVAQNNTSFQATAEEVNLDIDAQSESTLWRLKLFVKDAMETQSKAAASAGGNNDINDHSKNKNNNSSINSKRKREICDAIAKTARKRSKKPSS